LKYQLKNEIFLNPPTFFEQIFHQKVSVSKKDKISRIDVADVGLFVAQKKSTEKELDKRQKTRLL